MSDRSSQGSAASTTDCTGLGFDTSSSVRRILGAAMCSPSGGPESPSTKTFVKSTRPHSTDDAERWQESELALTLNGMDLRYPSNPSMLISSQAGSRAKTSPSPGNAAGSPGNAPGCSMSSPVSSTLFDPDGFSSRTYPDCSVATAVGTSESCLERWPTSGTAWHGGFSTHVSSECRSDEDGCSSSEPSLTEILEPPQTVPAKYSLSARAAQGILRRAQRRGKSLPDHLLAALTTVAWPSHSEHIAQ